MEGVERREAKGLEDSLVVFCFILHEVAAEFYPPVFCQIITFVYANKYLLVSISLYFGTQRNV